jgi:galactokinase
MHECSQTVELLKIFWPGAIGELLYASHESMRDDFEISIDELDCAVETAMQVGAVGARMTGGGFGGAAIALIHSSKVAELKASVSKAFEAKGFAKPELFSVLADCGEQKRES